MALSVSRRFKVEVIDSAGLISDHALSRWLERVAPRMARGNVTIALRWKTGQEREHLRD